MIRFASSLASKVVRLAKSKSSVQPIRGRHSWSRSASDIDFHFVRKLWSEHLDSGASFVQRIEDLRFFEAEVGTKYEDFIYHSLSREVEKELEAGVDVDELQRGIKMAYQVVKQHLKQGARILSFSSFEEISQIAKVAANGDGKVGDLVAKAMGKLGKSDFYMISNEMEACNKEIELTNAMELNWGCLSPYSYDIKPSKTCVLKHPLILIHESKILNKNFVKQAIGLLEMARQPLLIVTEEVDKEVAASLMPDRTCFKTEVYVVQVPTFQENRKKVMEDLAILTGGQVVTERSISITPQMLGSCIEVQVSFNFYNDNHETIILGGLGDQADVEERCKQLRSEIKLSTSDYEVNMLKVRLANLSRNAAVFEVGGAMQARLYKKKRIINALNAVKVAMETGIVPGGGVALLQASKGLDKLQATTSGGKIGVQLFQNALKIPVHTLAFATGFDGSVAVEKILKQDNLDLGYDLATGEYVEIIKSGNFDLLMVVLADLNAVVRRIESLCWHKERWSLAGMRGSVY